MATTSALPYMLEILSWGMQKVKKPQYQNSELIRRGVLTLENGIQFRRFSWHYSGVRGPVILSPLGVGTFRGSDTSLLKGLVVPRLVCLVLPEFRSDGIC